MADSAAGWLWLYPATYLVHIAEEYLAGERFFGWIARITRRSMRRHVFLSLNSIFLAGMIIGVVYATSNPSRSWLAPALGAITLTNGLGHLAGSIATRSYSPGLISGIALWVPLGAFTLFNFFNPTSPGTWTAGVALGLLLSGSVAGLGYLAAQPVE